ncbi:DUF3300 domain-containing protein, partial [Glaciimonas sp. GG7]
MFNKKTLSIMLSTSLCIAVLPLAGCKQDKTPDQAVAGPSAPTKSAYVPPTAEQLYQMVGPIALFPDKLVAQVLAGSTYPDQITAADSWLAQNRNLTASQLQGAANQQPWDVSVKGLTTFPDVLDQMAKNIQWTSALGEAYVNDPTDVMNAIQVLRQRASVSGNLKTTKQQRIAVRPRVQPATPPDYVSEPGEPQVYVGPEIVSAPPELIEIEPTEPNYVYVPTYDPRVVYGESIAVYPGYRYAPPRPMYSTGEMVTTGAISFGLGIAVGAVISNAGWGWNAWGVHWGGDRGRGPDDGSGRGPDGGGWRRPAVVYNNSTYVSRSTTIVNRVTNNYNNNYNNNSNNNFNNNNSINTRNNTNITTNNVAPGGNNRAPENGGVMHPGPANAPVFGAGGANGNNPARPNFVPQNRQTASVPPGARPEGGGAGQPNFNNMHRPEPGQNGGAAPAGTAPNFNTMTKPDFSHVAPNAGHNPPSANTHPMISPENVRPHLAQEPHVENNLQNKPSQTTGGIGNAHPERPEVQRAPQLQPQPRPEIHQPERPSQSQMRQEEHQQERAA